MMKYVVLGDIHANLPALEAVLAGIGGPILSVGDIIGYGPFPRECVEIARTRFGVNILGNHEETFSGGLYGMVGPNAAETLQWTSRNGNLGVWVDGWANRQFLSGECASWIYRHTIGKTMIAICQDDKFIFTHSSPVSDNQVESTYIDPNELKKYPSLEILRKIFYGLLNPDDPNSKKGLFCGHSHVPGAVVWDYKSDAPKVFPNNAAGRYSPVEDGYEFPLNKDQRFIVNVGSVGQPRDEVVDREGVYLPCWVEVHDDKIVFRRCSYDVGRTLRKMDELGEIGRKELERGPITVKGWNPKVVSRLKQKLVKQKS